MSTTQTVLLVIGLLASLGLLVLWAREWRAAAGRRRRLTISFDDWATALESSGAAPRR